METTAAFAFFCDQCGKCFSDKTTFHSHKRYHENDKKQCGECGIYFPNSFLLQQHSVSKHNSSKKYVWNVCEKSLIISECDRCNTKFPRKENLMRHKRKCGFADIKIRKQPLVSPCSCCNES